MSEIDIRHSHSLPLPEARAAIEDIAAKLVEKFDVSCAWNGDVLDFKRSGVDGAIALGERDVRVTAKLGFLLSAMRGPIESEIRRVLAERFGA
ncbi:polyhydroxyalkanoic acid system family protein [Luteimonas huabeiensis]|uniref:polyhydroxyalkanoic acid system family protein n=1 Tax=Luteimonas huabeiensis TaxID=1244513 RepID=UPI000464B2F5|nr:polyhydroxyalkanoic acid system family protein [Luteimonas huabeiensis]